MLFSIGPGHRDSGPMSLTMSLAVIGGALRYPDTMNLIHHLHAKLQPVVDEYPDGTAKFNGSSVLLQVGGRFFFVSAAHVFAAPGDGGTLHVIGDSRNVKPRLDDVVGGTDSSSPHPPKGRIDVAFVEVSSAEVERLGGAAAVQMDKVDVDESLKPRGRYLALGYPGSKTKVHYREGTLKVNPFAYHAGRAEPEIYAALGYSPNTHLILDYDRDSVSWTDQVERQGPHPRGMSGGGIWRVRNVDPEPPSPADAKLLAILIEYYAEQRVIVATRIAVVLEGIRLRYPELDSHLPRTRAVKFNVGHG
jgi:hypothetical protein